MGSRFTSRTSLVTVGFAMCACGGDVVGRSNPSDGVPRGSDADGGATGGNGGAVATDAGTSRLRVSQVPGSPPIVFDTLRNVNCTPKVAADGTERCLPTDPGRVLFTDAACSHAVIAAPPPDSCGQPSPRYFEQSNNPACFSNTTIYTLGAALDAGATLYSSYASVCAIAASLGGPYYEAVPSDPTDWVELSPDVTPVTDQLGVASWKTADGAVIFDGLRLLPSKHPCDVSPAIGDPDARCIPGAIARSGGAYADPQCSGDVLMSRECGPAYLVSTRSDSTGPFAGLFEIGSTVTDAYVSNTWTNWQCVLVPFSTLDPYYFYTAGAPLAPDRYPPIGTKMDGSGRIRTEYVTSEGKNLFAHALYDSRFGEECWPTVLTGGGTWCVPGSATYLPGGTYADSGCTVPIGLATGLTYPSWALTGESDPCSSVESLRSTTPYEGPVYEIFAGPISGSCTPAGKAARGTAFQLGPPLDPATVFAPIPR